MEDANYSDKLGKGLKVKRVHLSVGHKVVCLGLRHGLQDGSVDGKAAILHERSGCQREHEMNMSQEGQTVVKKANILLGCINNAGISKKHEIVLLFHHSWSTGSSVGHCISRKMQIS